MKQNLIKLIFFGFWLSGITLGFVFFWKSGLTITSFKQVIAGCIQRWYLLAPVAYIILYIIRPLIFFPATLLTTLSGALFGPAWGIAYTMVGENLSANISFLVGRYFGKNVMQELIARNRVIPFFDRRIYENQFLSILILRLFFLPFDLVGFMAGFRHLRQLDFALGTFLGIIPGLVTFVLLGSSLVDPKNLVFTGMTLIAGIAISLFLKKRAAHHLPKVL
jgi:uncharacterized membrane protein YdjX (TVP38/TMEM64 family)